MNINIDNVVDVMKNFGILSSDQIRNRMSEILSHEPYVGWEFGPDSKNVNNSYLALTCNGNLECLTEISSELGLPLLGDKWSILAGSPKKSWDRYFELKVENGNFVGIEGGRWKWKLRKCTEKAEIYLYTEDLCKGVDIYQAAKILLIGELGEYVFAKYISIIDIYPYDNLDESCFFVSSLSPFIEDAFLRASLDSEDQ